MEFQEGVHFIGYRNEEDLVPLIREHLTNDAARIEIAKRAHDLVWSHHTYDCRAATILSRLRDDAGQLFAPARQWTEEQVALTYIDYFTAHMYLRQAHKELKILARKNLLKAGLGATFLLKAYLRKIRYSKLFNPRPVPPIPTPSAQKSDSLSSANR